VARIRFAFFLCCLGLLPAPASDAADTDIALEMLKQAAANIRTLRCAFTQSTDIPLFSQPIESRGRLLYAAPESLVWEYTSPARQGFVLTGDSGFRWEGERSRRIGFSTAKDPVAGLIAAQMLAWVRFDRSWIEANYTVTVTRLSPIALTLRPKQSEVASVLSALHLAFAEDGVAREIRLQETSGGSTRIDLRDIVLNGPLEAGEFR
jgi:outer membrane lipoprotein-sorting protein